MPVHRLNHAVLYVSDVERSVAFYRDYHLAWEVDTLAELERLAGVLAEAGALVGASDHGTTKSLYAKDPDGLEFEVVWIIPANLLDESAKTAQIRPLDLTKEKARYGADTRGGVGISIPA
jgi:catechol-2,3-dioxygenase